MDFHPDGCSVSIRRKSASIAYFGILFKNSLRLSGIHADGEWIVRLSWLVLFLRDVDGEGDLTAGISNVGDVHIIVFQMPSLDGYWYDG